MALLGSNRRRRKELAPRRVPTVQYYRNNINTQATQSPQREQSRAGETSGVSRRTKLVNLFLIVILLAAVIAAASLSTNVSVQAREDQFQFYPPEVYADSARQILQHHPLMRTKLLFQSRVFEREFQQMHPEVDTVSSIVPLGGRNLTVQLVISRPFAVLHNGATTQVLNENGVIIADASEIELPPGLITIKLTNRLEDQTAGSPILTKEEVALLSLLQRELATFQVNQESLRIREVLFSISDGRMMVSFHNAPYSLVLSSYQPADIQIGAMKATLVQLGSSGGLPERSIDVRVPGKVYII